ASSAAPTWSDTSSSAVTPPKRTDTPAISSMLCARTTPREHGQQATGRKQDHRRQQRAQHDLMADRHDGLEHELIDEIHDDRANDGAEERPVAAEDGGDDRQHRPQA